MLWLELRNDELPYTSCGLHKTAILPSTEPKKYTRLRREIAMEKSEAQHHILVLPFPVVGHINPMLQLSKRLAAKASLKITFLLPHSFCRTAQNLPPSIDLDAFSDGTREGEKLKNILAYVDIFHLRVPENLSQYIRESQTNSKSNHRPTFLIYDSFIPWALDIALQHGLGGAPFFTQCASVSAIAYQAHTGELKTCLQDESLISVPFLPRLGAQDLPSFVQDTGAYPVLLKQLLEQFSNVNRASFIFINTVSELEEEVVKWMESQWPIKTIGPTLPSKYLDNRLEDDSEYGLNLFNPNVDTCMKWLDSKETCSVTYVSYGSLAEMGIEAMEELAWGLRNSNTYFLWVVRESEQGKLPSTFIEETSDKGLVVIWCPQLDVLAHQAVGCFVTHCGWNSTLEALSLGVPMVAMPQWTDQPTNAKFIEDVWRVGVRVKQDGNGNNMVKREEFERCIRKVMEGEQADEMRMNAAKWKELIKKAADVGGSSDRNIEEFVASFDAKTDQN